MPNIATLTVTLAADSARYVAELAKADRKSKSFVGSVQKAVKVGVTAIAAAGTAAATALTALTVSQLQAVDALAKTSDKLGIAIDKLAALQLAGRLTGVQNEKLSLGLQRMTRRIAEAAKGTGEAQGAIKELGLDAEELARLPLDQQFQRIAGAMQNVNAQSDKIRLGFKLFDSEGVDLIRTLDVMGRDFARIEEEARAFGVAISRVDARKVENANDAVERAQTALQGIGTTIAVTVSPLIDAVATGFADSALEADGFKREIEATMRALVVGANFAANSIRGIALAIQTAKLAALTVQEEIEERTGKSFGANVESPEGGFGISASLGLQTKTADQQAKALKATRDEIDATGAAIHRLLDNFQSADEALAKFDKLIAEATARAQAQVAPPDTVPGGEVPEGLTDEERTKLEGRIQAVRESLFTETEVVRQAFIDRALIAVEAFDNEVIAQEERDQILLDLAREHADALLRIEEEKQEKINRAVLSGIHTREEFEKASLKTQVKGVLGTLESITAGVATHSKGLFRLNQAAAIANAVINTAEGVTKALSAYPPPLSFAMAAAQAAAGAVQIAAIRSAQFGGGTTPSVAGSVPTLEGQPVQQPQAIEAGPQKIAEVHIHGSLLAGQDTRDSVKRWVREITDSDEVIIHPASRQAAIIRAST